MGRHGHSADAVMSEADPRRANFWRADAKSPKTACFWAILRLLALLKIAALGACRGHGISMFL